MGDSGVGKCCIGDSGCGIGVDMMGGEHCLNSRFRPRGRVEEGRSDELPVPSVRRQRRLQAGTPAARRDGPPLPEGRGREAESPEADAPGEPAVPSQVRSTKRGGLRKGVCSQPLGSGTLGKAHRLTCMSSNDK